MCLCAPPPGRVATIPAHINQILVVVHELIAHELIATRAAACRYSQKSIAQRLYMVTLDEADVSEFPTATAAGCMVRSNSIFRGDKVLLV